MNKIIRLLLPLLSLGALGSCLNDDPATTTEASAPIISNIAMGNLKRIITTRDSAGAVKTTTGTFAAAKVPLYIDQLNNRIYTPDSLPKGVRIDKVVFSAINATGTVRINRLSAAGDTIFSSTDSTDFTSPRTLKVYGTDGSTTRTYTMEILVHKQEADSTSWTRHAASALQGIAVRRAFAVGTSLVLFGTDGTTPVMLTAQKASPTVWTRTQIALSNFDASSVQRMNGAYYALAGTTLLRSTDGAAWTALSPSVTPSALVAASDSRLIAVSSGTLYASTDGTTWTAEPVDLTDGVLPTAKFAGAASTLSTDATLVDYLLIGEASGAMVAWRRTVDTTGGETYPWVYYPAPSRYALPSMDAPMLAPYGSGTLLVGMANGAPTKLSWSRDNGRTWRTDLISTPSALSGTSIALATDDDHFIWLFTGGSGQVWQGRLNSLGWTSEQTSFTSAPKFVP